MEQTFFSIVIPVTSHSAYLLPITLDSIDMQATGKYELILVDGTKGGIHVLTKGKILPAHSTRIFEMMNEGLKETQGDYIHFLRPGEFYISRHAFSCVGKFIHSFGSPDVVYTGCFLRSRFAHPEVYLQQTTLHKLESGQVPGCLHSYWFKRDILLRLGGFSAKYQEQGGLDLICRLYRMENIRKAFMRRILTDYEYRRLFPKVALRQFGETLLVVLKHFGFHFSLLPWIVQNCLQLFRWWWKIVRTAFWKQNVA